MSYVTYVECLQCFKRKTVIRPDARQPWAPDPDSELGPFQGTCFAAELEWAGLEFAALAGLVLAALVELLVESD